MYNKNFVTSLLTLVFLCSFTPVKKQDLDLVFVGDSITYGVLIKKAPPLFACDYLRQQPAIHQVTASNQGVSGYTTVDFLPGTGTVFNKVETATQELLRDHPGNLIFSIMLGTNDSAEKGTNGAPVAPDAYRSNLKAIIGRLMRDFPSCKLVINYPIWYSPNTYNGAKYLQAGLTRLQSYFPVIKSLVSAYAVSSPGRVFQGDPNVFNTFKNHYKQYYTPQSGHQGTFYLHPNEKGARELGRYWGKAIDQAAGL